MTGTARQAAEDMRDSHALSYWQTLNLPLVLSQVLLSAVALGRREWALSNDTSVTLSVKGRHHELNLLSGFFEEASVAAEFCGHFFFFF